MVEADVRRGELLRWWREQALQIGLVDFAERMGVSTATASQWESGARGFGATHIRKASRMLTVGSETFCDIFERAGSVAAVPAAERWEHNYLPGSGPILLWVRGQPDVATTISMRWGIVECEDVRVVPRLGLFVAGREGPRNPRVVVDLDPVGWVDFLTQPFPTELGLDVVDAFDFLRPIRRSSIFAVLWAKHIWATFGPAAVDAASSLGMNEQFIVNTIRHAVVDQPDTEETRRLSESEAATPDTVRNGRALRHARDAYGLSQTDIATRMTALASTALPSIEVSQDVVSRIEAGRMPRDRTIVALLDRALGTDGRLVSVPYKSAWRGSLQTLFPDWWVGPVWIDVVGGPGRLTVRWNPYMKTIDVPAGGAIFALRCADPTNPVLITVEPPTLDFKVGLGRVADSIDLNDDWDPVSESHLRNLLREGEEVATRVVGRSQKVLDRFRRG